MKPEPCTECGCTDWLVSVVYERGVRLCLDCVVGRTTLVRNWPAEQPR